MPIRVKTGLKEHFGESGVGNLSPHTFGRYINPIPIRIWEGQITRTASDSLPPPHGTPDLEMFHRDCKDFTLDHTSKTKCVDEKILRKNKTI